MYLEKTVVKSSNCNSSAYKTRISSIVNNEITSWAIFVYLPQQSVCVPPVCLAAVDNAEEQNWAKSKPNIELLAKLKQWDSWRKRLQLSWNWPQLYKRLLRVLDCSEGSSFPTAVWVKKKNLFSLKVTLKLKFTFKKKAHHNKPVQMYLKCCFLQGSSPSFYPFWYNTPVCFSCLLAPPNHWQLM